MEQVSHWLASVPRSAWVAILSALAFAGFRWLAQRPLAADADGWTRIRPTAAVVGLTGLSILLTLFVSVWFVVAMGAIILHPAEMLGGDAGRAMWVVLIAPPLSAMFGYSAVYTLFCKLRFNAEGLEQRYLGRRRFVPWAEMDAMKRHWLLGPRLHPKSGRPIQLSEIYRGFEQFLTEAQANGVTIAL